MLVLVKLLKNWKIILKKFCNFITDENVTSHFEYKFLPQKIVSNLTNFIVYDLETHKRDRDRSYCISSFRLSKLAGRYKRDLSQYD